MRLTSLTRPLCAAGLGLALTACGGGAGGGTAQLSTDSANPESAVGVPVQALLNNDVAGLVNWAPPEARAELERDWPGMRSQLAGQLAMPLAMLSNEEAIGQVREQLRSQVAMAAEMAASQKDQMLQQAEQAGPMMGAMLSGGDQALAEQISGDMQRVVAAAGQWFDGAGFDDPDKAVAAFDTMLAAVKSTGITTPAEIEALSLDQALTHAGTMLGAIKQVGASYNLDVDAILRSITATQGTGENPELSLTMTMFGETLTTPAMPVHQANGKWQPGPAPVQ